jgi:putative tryptophan/tyrosine transport system substrate-binding protein
MQVDVLKRREFIRLVGGVAVAWPLGARAQQSALPVVGVLSASSAELSTHGVRAFRQGLSETGHIEGRNIVMEYRWANGQNNQLPALAADLVRSQVSVIVALGSTPAAVAAKASTITIPIVFQVGSDPVAAGLVTSLVRPGGNATGVTNLNTELEPKRLELLRQVVPTANVIALLVNPSSPFITETVSRDLETAARILGLQLHILHASSEREFEEAFEHLVQARAAALVIAPDALFINRSDQLAELTARCDASNQPISRICTRRRADELRRELY